VTIAEVSLDDGPWIEEFVQAEIEGMLEKTLMFVEKSCIMVECYIDPYTFMPKTVIKAQMTDTEYALYLLSI
jgi:hypothetical protein